MSPTGYAVMGLIATIFGGGGLASYLLIKPQSARLGAETAASLTAAAAELIEPLRRENRDLRERLTRLEREVREIAQLRRDRDRLSMRVAHLEHLLEQHGIEVPSLPPDV